MLFRSHHRVIAHEGEVVVGLIKKCIRGAGYRRRRAQRGAAEPRERPHTQHRRWYCTAEYCGRVGSRHFLRHRGFFPEGSLFVSLRATGYILTIFLFCLPLSVRQKKCRNEETTTRREVYRTPYWGKKNRSVVICKRSELFIKGDYIKPRIEHALYKI